MNLPIPAFSGDEAYTTLLRELVIPFLKRNQPDMLLVSFGFDTHWRDPLGSMQLSAGCIYQIVMDLREWVNDHCDGKIAVILEGGYDLEAGKACGGAIAAALADVGWQDELGPSPTAENDTWRGALEAGKDLWGL